jgi:hypothetical protein
VAGVLLLFCSPPCARAPAQKSAANHGTCGKKDTAGVPQREKTI